MIDIVPIINTLTVVFIILQSLFLSFLTSKISKIILIIPIDIKMPLQILSCRKRALTMKGISGDDILAFTFHMWWDI